MPVPRTGAVTAVDAFVSRARSLAPVADGRAKRGRLLFCMDATASREPTWDRAAAIQGEMFVAAEALGGLDVRLAFWRGFQDFKVSKWTADGRELARLMSGVDCLAGHTQIGRALAYAAEQAAPSGLRAMVLVGDAFEEPLDAVGHVAGQLGMLGLPVFAFQEGEDPDATRAFAQIARLSGGRHCRFESGSADELKRLLGAVAAFAAGGQDALTAYARLHRGAALRLTDARA